MSNGRSPLGERIRGWFDDLYETIGLKALLDRNRERNEEWDNIRSLSDLRAWVRRWGGANPWEITEKAIELGASQDEVRDILDPGYSDLRADPSNWLGDKIGDAFGSPLWQEFNQVFGTAVFDPWLASIVGGALPTDSPEVDRVRQFLGTQMAFETLGSVVSLLVETATAGQVENAGKIFSDAKWTLGTCFTSWQSTAPIVEAVILKPLQRLINATFREADFTRAQWMDLYALGKIDPGRLGEELARQGYSSEKIGWILDLAERQPSRGDLLAMWKAGIVTPAMFAEGLRRQGYTQEWIDRFMRLYQEDEASEEKGAYLGTLRKAFKEQLISEADFRRELKSQGRSDAAIDLEVAVLSLSWEVEAKTAAKSDVRKAFMEDVIGGPEVRHWLAGAGFTTHAIDLLLATWERERAPTYKTLNKSEIIKAWGFNILSRSEAYQRLLDIGYDADGATVLMETYARSHLAVKPPDTYVLRPQDILLAWHAAVIEEPEVYERLADIGLTEEDAQLLFATYQRLHPRVAVETPLSLKKDDILEAWGRGVLTEDGAYQRLVDAGYDEQDAGILMDSYELRPEALPVEPTVSELVGATRRGVITPEVLSQRLTALGMRAEDVQFYTAYALAPLPETTRSLSRTDIVKLWTEGRHDRAWAIQRLLNLNYSPEDVDDILWLSAPEIEDTETFVLLQAGLIDVLVASAMWLTMGFSQDQIDAVLAG